MALQAHSTLLPHADIATCMDPKLGEDYDTLAAELMFDKAKECISRDSKDRPTMSEVVGFLNAVRSDMDRQLIGMRRSMTSSRFGSGSTPAHSDGSNFGSTGVSTPPIGDSRGTSFNFVSETMERGR